MIKFAYSRYFTNDVVLFLLLSEKIVSTKFLLTLGVKKAKTVARI